MLVKNWMRQNPITVTPGLGAKEAFLLLKKHRIRQLPVLRDGLLVGIVTDRDFRRPDPRVGYSSHDEVYRIDDRLSVGDIMTIEVLTVNEDTPIDEAARLLLKHKINGLPVISEDGRLTGMITTSDILGAFLWLSDQENKS